MQVKIVALWDCPNNLQLLTVVLGKDSAEFGLTIAAIPVVLILLAGCTYAVKEEIKWYGSFICLLGVTISPIHQDHGDQSPVDGGFDDLL